MLTGVRGDPISQGTKYSGANQPGAVTAALDSLKKNHRRKGEQWVNIPEARQMGRIEKIGDCTLMLGGRGQNGKSEFRSGVLFGRIYRFYC